MIMGTLLLTTPFVNASPATTWQQTYGGSAADRAYSTVNTTDGGYALIGTTNSFGSGLINTWLVKTNSEGKIQWNQTYSGEGQSIAEYIIQTNDEGYAFAGYTYSLDQSKSGQLYTWIAKTNYAGALEWNQTYNQIESAIAYSLIQTSDHGYALVGAYNTPTGRVEGWVSKTDSIGNVQWNKTYGVSGYDQLNTIIQESDGTFVLAGSNSPSSSGPSSLWLIRTDSSGNVQWNQTYKVSDNDVLSNMVKTADGGYALIGWSTTGSSNVDYLLVKANSAGDEQWSKTYAGQNVSQALAGIQTSDQGFALAGVTNSSNPAFAKAWLVKTDSSGNPIWNQTYGGSSQNAATSIMQASDGGYVLGGFTNSFGAGDEDFWLLKTDANGASIPEFSGTYLALLAISLLLIIVVTRKKRRDGTPFVAR